MSTLKNIFLLLSGGQGFFLSLALISSSIKKRNSNIFLGLILMVCSIELLNVWAMSLKFHSSPHAFPFWIFGSYLILPCSVLMFFMFNIIPAFKFHKNHLLLFVPALIEIIIEFSVFYLRRGTDMVIVFPKSIVWFFFTELLPIVWMTVVLLYSNHLLQKHSAQDNKRPFQLYRQYSFLIMFSLLTILWIADGIFYLRVYSTIQSMLCVFLFVMGYVVYFKPDFFETPLASKRKSGEELFADYDDEDSMQRLRGILVHDKLYLTPRLTLEQTANQLNLPSRYVSYLINEKGKGNFTTFINAYRIEEVLRRLNDPKEGHKTIVGIALDSGFNSKSSFNQVFKTIKGQTPTEYLSNKVK